MTPEFSPKPRSLAWPSRFAISLLILSACSTLVAQSVFFERVDIVTGLPLAGNVLTGDFNNDGKPDIILDTLTSSEGASVFLLLGNGDGTFSPPTRLWGWLGAPKAADVNADGNLDLVFTDGSNIWVTLGKGDGTFGDYIKSPLTAGAGGRHLVVDLNRDGKPDVVLVLQDGGLALALGNGDGTFGSFTTYPLSGGGVAGYVAAADFRGAGKMDLGATNEGTPPYYRGATVSVLSGNGDGTFGPATDFTAGEGAFRLVTGDFNGDGKIDLGVGNYHSASVSVLLGNGDGTFLPKTDFYVGEFPVALGSADFNGDGKLDFAVGGAPLALSILSGNGDGSFAVKQDFPSANSIKSLEVAD
ncbi:MAG: FG-GAP repeat domain-containing protein, partial [Acidobacteriaceae bacterium]